MAQVAEVALLEAENPQERVDSAAAELAEQMAQTA